MIINLTFKTPDVADYALEDLTEDQKYEAEEVIEKFVKFGEYVTISIDTETGEATVEKCK